MATRRKFTSFIETKKIGLIEKLESNYEVLKEEYLKSDARFNLPLIDDLLMGSKVLNKNNKWRARMLKSFFYIHEESLAESLRTREIIDDEAVCSAFYSVLEPHLEIPAHYGNNKGLFRILFPLIVPNHNVKCFIVVNDELRLFEEGIAIMFHDYFKYSVVNNAEDKTVVIFIDYVRKLPFPFSITNKIALKSVSNSIFMKRLREKSIVKCNNGVKTTSLQFSH